MSTDEIAEALKEGMFGVLLSYKLKVIKHLDNKDAEKLSRYVAASFRSGNKLADNVGDEDLANRVKSFLQSQGYVACKRSDGKMDCRKKEDILI